jgi:hypothetical protein
VEGDSLVIFQALKQQEACFVIVQDVRQLSSSLTRVGFSHVRRTGNRVAHVLARHAIVLSSDFLVWMEDVPSFLEDVIQSEFSFITTHFSQKKKKKTFQLSLRLSPGCYISFPIYSSSSSSSSPFLHLSLTVHHHPRPLRGDIGLRPSEREPRATE